MTTSQTTPLEGQSGESSPSPEALMQALIDGPAPADGTPPEATSDAAPPQPTPIPVPETPATPPEQTPTETPAQPSPELLEAQRQLAEQSERIAAFERQAAEAAQAKAEADDQANIATIRQGALEYQARLEREDGLTPEKAKEVSQEKAGLQYENYQIRREAQYKMEAAQAIAKQHGISPEALMAMDSPDAMQSEAKRLSETGALRAEMAEMKAEMAKTLAPLQNFATPGGASPAPSDDATRIARMGNRDNPEPLTDDSIKWFKDYIAQG